MELTDLERAEFTALANETFDPGLWSEDEYPTLKRAKREYEEEQERERGGVPPSERPNTPEDRPHLLPPRHSVRATESMASDTPLTAVESLPASATRLELAAMCPQVSHGFPLSESQKEKHAKAMTDTELTYYVESKLRPVGETLRHNLVYIREARDRFAHPGRRVPVPGQPTFTEWIRQNVGISARHVRRLLAGPKESADRSSEDEMEQTPKRQKRDEVMWQAGRMAHAALGLLQTDERDPSGSKRKSALIAMAQEFLNLAGRKHISVIVRLKELQPADFRAIYGILAQCCDMQLDQVFGSLEEPERTEALRLLAQQIGNRYQESSGQIRAR